MLLIILYIPYGITYCANFFTFSLRDTYTKFFFHIHHQFYDF